MSEDECGDELSLYHDVCMFCRQPKDHDGPHEETFVQYRDDSGKSTRVTWETVMP